MTNLVRLDHKIRNNKKYHAGWHGTGFVVLFLLKRLDQPKRTPTVSISCGWLCYEKHEIPKIYQNIGNVCMNRRKENPPRGTLNLKITQKL